MVVQIKSGKRGNGTSFWDNLYRKRSRAVERGGPSTSQILYEKSLNVKTISQGDFGHSREKNQIILSKVAKIALRDCF